MIVQELVATLGLDVDESSFTFADKVMGIAKGGLLALGAAAAAAAVGLAAAVAKTAEHADQIQKAAQRTGIGVEALQALQYAAERADVSAEGLQGALNFMAKRGVKDFEAEIRRAADELAAMPDGGEKAARAMKLFGKQGAALIPMLNEGSAGIDKMTTFAREAGLVLGEDMVEDGASLKDALEALQGFVRGLAFTLAGPLLKPAREWMKAMGEWIKANRAIIAQRVEKVITSLAVGFKYAWQVLKPLGELLWAVVSNVWVLRGAAAALAFTLMASLGRSAIAAGSAIAGLARGFMGMAVSGLGAMVVPALIGAALLGLALVAEDVYQFLQGNDSLMGTLGVKYTKWLDQVLAVDPSDSALVKGLKYVGQVIFDIQGALMKLDAWIRKDSVLQNAVSGAGATAGFMLSGVAAALPGQMGADAAKNRDARWNEMGFYGGRLANNVGDAAAQSWADSAHYDPAAWTSLPSAPAAAGGASVSVGQVVVNVPGGDAKAIAESVGREIDLRLQQAHRAVGR